MGVHMNASWTDGPQNISSKGGFIRLRTSKNVDYHILCSPASRANLSFRIHHVLVRVSTSVSLALYLCINLCAPTCTFRPAHIGAHCGTTKLNPHKRIRIRSKFAAAWNIRFGEQTYLLCYSTNSNGYMFHMRTNGIFDTVDLHEMLSS